MPLVIYELSLAWSPILNMPRRSGGSWSRRSGRWASDRRSR